MDASDQFIAPHASTARAQAILDYTLSELRTLGFGAIAEPQQWNHYNPPEVFLTVGDRIYKFSWVESYHRYRNEVLVERWTVEGPDIPASRKLRRAWRSAQPVMFRKRLPDLIAAVRPHLRASTPAELVRQSSIEAHDRLMPTLPFLTYDGEAGHAYKYIYHHNGLAPTGDDVLDEQLYGFAQWLDVQIARDVMLELLVAADRIEYARIQEQ